MSRTQVLKKEENYSRSGFKVMHSRLVQAPQQRAGCYLWVFSHFSRRQVGSQTPAASGSFAECTGQAGGCSAQLVLWKQSKHLFSWFCFSFFLPRFRGACRPNHFLLCLQKLFLTAMVDMLTATTSPTPVTTRLRSAPHPLTWTTGTG